MQIMMLGILCLVSFPVFAGSTVHQQSDLVSRKGIHIFQVFCQIAILGKEKVFWFFFYFPSSGRLNSEGVFTVDRFCISKCNQIYLRFMPQVNLLTEKYIPRDIALHMVPLLVQAVKVRQV